MDAQLKSKWIEALRSGKFKQGTGYLECEGAYCCLGVLAQIQGNDVAKWPLQSKRTSNLPEGLRAELSKDEMAQLAHHNDGTAGYKSFNFPGIADYIEKNL